MKLSLALATLVLVCLQTAAARRGGKKGKQLAQAPQWKANSHPGKDERFESQSEGKTLRLDCRAKGKPTPKVMWFKDGQKLSKADDHVDIEKFKLTINSLAVEDRGNYTCVVNNTEGHMEWTFYVDVIVKLWPLIMEGPENITATVGETVHFRCRTLNDPEATIRWARPKAPDAVHVGKSALENSDFLETNGNPEVLELRNIQPEDAGKYRCLAGNVWGLKFSDAYLNIERPVTSSEATTTTTTTTTTTEAATQPSWPFGPVPPQRNPYLPVFTYGPDLYETTRPPRNKNGRRKNGRRRKPPKNKHSLTTTTTDEPSTTSNPFTTIWNFDERLNREDTGITYNQPSPDDSLDTDYGETGSQGMGEGEGWISLWTIYTIVGAVAGVILLIGLLAITIAVCCRRDGGSVYKSTPV